MTSYAVRKGDPAETRTDLLVVGVGTDSRGNPVVAPGGEPVAAALGRSLGAVLSAAGSRGRIGDAVRVPVSKGVSARSLLLVGVGPIEQITADVVRNAAGVAARNLGTAASVALALPAADEVLLRAVLDGFLAGSYSYDPATGTATKPRVAEVAVFTELGRQKVAKDALARAEVEARWRNFARDLVTAPPNQLGPAQFVDRVEEIRPKKSPVALTVWDEDKLAEERCGGILGVGLGSALPPRLLRLDYRPREAVGHIALVGKGITYDSGGLTIKPGASMPLMKNDMAGAAAMVATTFAAAELGLPVAITTFVPLAENMLSGTAMRPGDVLTMRDGRTVEITNTDAEGRLVLADALVLAAEEAPDQIVNVATLTGPCVVALGDRIAGLFGTDPALVAAIKAASTATGEAIWELPLLDEMRARIRSEAKVADLLQHNWVRWGSPAWAAGFLMEFVGDVPFAHVDIAGPAWNSGAAYGFTPSGATGFSMSLVLEHLMQLGQ